MSSIPETHSPLESDHLLLFVSRKVLRDSASGGRDAERVKLKLEIVVEVISSVYSHRVAFFSGSSCNHFGFQH